MDAVAQSLELIRNKAKEYRSVALETPARVLEWAANLVDEAVHVESERLVYLEEATKISGLSVGHLARLVRKGKIPDRRPPGTRGRILMRISDLPIKRAHAHTPIADVRDVASRLYNRQGRP